jgi:hypothetical protein
VQRFLDAPGRIARGIRLQLEQDHVLDHAAEYSAVSEESPRLP